MQSKIQLAGFLNYFQLTGFKSSQIWLETSQNGHTVKDINGIKQNNRTFSSVYASDKIKPWCRNSPDLDGIVIDEHDDGSEDSEIVGDFSSGTAELSNHT